MAMSFYVIILIMLLCGIFGGYINFLLPANDLQVPADNDDRTDGTVTKSRKVKYDIKIKLQPLGTCIFLGIGATVLVPLFLEIAQSKLLDNIHYGFQTDKTASQNTIAPKDSMLVNIVVKTDSLKKDTSRTVVAIIKTNDKETDDTVPLKNYLLFAAYCLVAAASGLRFITSVTDSVLKQQLKEARKETAEEKEKKEQAEKDAAKAEADAKALAEANEKTAKNNQLKQVTELEKLGYAAPVSLKSQTTKPLQDTFELPAITNMYDPQKGRFGGKPENNGRRLSATVKPSSIPEFYDVQLIVETTRPDKPLDTDVVFYVHDSLSPSVFVIKTASFLEGKAISQKIKSFGAFTVGVITDDGATKLELDLAENTDYPAPFRAR